MRTRRVRVPGVPVDFRVPPAWPTPTDRWVQDNLFWQPPPGWTPRPDLRPAPPGWRYWSPNPGWQRATAPVHRSIDRWATASELLGGVCVVLVVVAAFVEIPLAAEAIGWVAGAAAVGCFVVYATLRHRITGRVLAEAAVYAEQARRERLTREYQRYRWALG